MNIMDVALKDLKRVLRSVFALIMMFGAPLLIAGLLYFAFGGLASGNGSFTLARTRVVIANLDQPGSPGGAGTFKAGEMLIHFLENEDLKDILELSIVADEASARAAVDHQEADVALIIPANFTQAALTPDLNVAVLLYQDPTLSIGPGILKDLVNHFMDGFSGAKIAANVTDAAVQAGGAQADPALSEQAARQYAAYLESSSHAAALHISSPSGTAEQAAPGLSMIGPIMAGMMIFFVFFMGANGAESIIREHEEGTLARLFATPVSALTILSGKFVGVFITLVIQTAVLLGASALIFHISWGKPLSAVLATFGLIVAATGFGVMLMSFVKSTRQTGPILGGVLMITGMVGGLVTNGIPNVPEIMDTIALSMPQGWAMQAWKLSLTGAEAGALILPTLVLVVLGALFFAVGLASFRRRFV
ncbi:MAG TPA: ABC transporter permease [Anaerolineales bacterium]|nr:ABC transporter permease [Anaerolineales bacterium]